MIGASIGTGAYLLYNYFDKIDDFPKDKSWKSGDIIVPLIDENGNVIDVNGLGDSTPDDEWSLERDVSDWHEGGQWLNPRYWRMGTR